MRCKYKINVSYRHKIVKHSGYVAKVCDGDFNKKHVGIDLFSLQFCVYKLVLKIFCKKPQNLFQDVGDVFL